VEFGEVAFVGDGVGEAAEVDVSGLEEEMVRCVELSRRGEEVP
jgi:hypothetical protein